MKSLGVTIQIKATKQYFAVELTDYYAVQGDFNFLVCGSNPRM